MVMEGRRRERRKGATVGEKSNSNGGGGPSKKKKNKKRRKKKTSAAAVPPVEGGLAGMGEATLSPRLAPVASPPDRLTLKVELGLAYDWSDGSAYGHMYFQLHI